MVVRQGRFRAVWVDQATGRMVHAYEMRYGLDMAMRDLEMLRDRATDDQSHHIRPGLQRFDQDRQCWVPFAVPARESVESR